MRWQDFNFQKWKEEFNKWRQQNPADPIDNNCQTIEAIVATMGEVPPRPFRPVAFYNRDGDMVEVYLSDVAFYGKWLNPQITLLLAFETHEIVGIQICGAKRIFEEKDLPA